MSKRYNEPPANRLHPDKSYTATLTTAKGTITMRLYADIAPILVNNFVFLANDKFYNETRIHRVLDETLVQMGDPTGIGKSGAGYKVPDDTAALALNHKRGSVSMANAGRDTNSSQFFISLAAIPEFDGLYCVIGEVLGDGMEVVDTWSVGDVIESVRIETI